MGPELLEGAAGLCRALGVTAHLQQQAKVVVRAVVQRLDCHGLPQRADRALEVAGRLVGAMLPQPRQAVVGLAALRVEGEGGVVVLLRTQELRGRVRLRRARQVLRLSQLLTTARLRVSNGSNV